MNTHFVSMHTANTVHWLDVYRDVMESSHGREDQTKCDMRGWPCVTPLNPDRFAFSNLEKQFFRDSGEANSPCVTVNNGGG